MRNLNVVMISVASLEDGLVVLDWVDSAVDAGELTVEDVAMVSKRPNGKVKIHQTGDATAGTGALRGGGLGLLVGVFAAPLVPAIAVGAGIGALVSKARDQGISNELIEQAGALIENNGAVVFILTDRASATSITTLIDEAIAGGSKVAYGILSEDGQILLREAHFSENP